MIDGFIKVACGIPEIEVADCVANRVRIRDPNTHQIGRAHV